MLLIGIDFNKKFLMGTLVMFSDEPCIKGIRFPQKTRRTISTLLTVSLIFPLWRGDFLSFLFWTAQKAHHMQSCGTTALQS